MLRRSEGGVVIGTAREFAKSPLENLVNALRGMEKYIRSNNVILAMILFTLDIRSLGPKMAIIVPKTE